MKMRTIILNIILTFVVLNAHSQSLEKYKDLINPDDNLEIVKSNFEDIKKIDLNKFWINNPIERRHGFIGSNYRRLDIKFLSIIKNSKSPNQYFVYGKSRVSKNICEFQGTLEIQESYDFKSLEFGNCVVIAGDYTFFESPEIKSSGMFNGRFVTYCTKSATGELGYLDLPATRGNNQFSGEWKDYKKQKGIVANWGDSRIPNSGDLDVGTSEFGINLKYQMYGWDSFIKTQRGRYDKETMEEAIKAEDFEWWKN
jgi:hypothetical protein